MRNLYLLEKPWADRSQQFKDYASSRLAYSSRWNWIGPGKWVDGKWTFTERGSGPYGPVTHTFGREAKYAYQYWVRYEYTGDEAWLRNRAYPMLKGVAEFYRNYPNVKKGSDGKYHIYYVNSNESVWGARDTDEEISGMRGVLPVAIKASEILGVDADLRARWREFLANLAPLPRSDDPEAGVSRNGRPPSWIRGLPPIVEGRSAGRTGGPDGNTMPQWFFDLCTLESDAETLRIGQATVGAAGRNGGGVLSKLPLVNAILGRADAVRTAIPGQLDGEPSILANRMDLREGPQTTTCQRLGNAADALHTALCQDLPAGPGQLPVLRLFAAWPKEWDAEFSLLCRGGFLVTSSMQKGEIEFVEIQSQLGGECRLRNPWAAGQVDLYRSSSQPESVSGDLLRFNIPKGQTAVLVRSGAKPDQYKRGVAPTVNATTGPGTRRVAVER